MPQRPDPLRPSGVGPAPDGTPAAPVDDAEDGDVTVVLPPGLGTAEGGDDGADGDVTVVLPPGLVVLPVALTKAAGTSPAGPDSTGPGPAAGPGLAPPDGPRGEAPPAAWPPAGTAWPAGSPAAGPAAVPPPAWPPASAPPVTWPPAAAAAPPAGWAQPAAAASAPYPSTAPAPAPGRRLSALDWSVAAVAGLLALSALVLTLLAPVYPKAHIPASLRSLLPSPPAAAGATPDANALPAAMAGTWTGTVTQHSSTASEHYTVELTLTAGQVGQQVGTSVYTASGWSCDGTFTLTSGGSTVQGNEAFPRSRECGGDVLTLRLDASGELVYHFDDAGQGTGDGVLTRKP
jgi:hypothetical protein